MRRLVDVLARHIITTTLAASLLTGAAGAAVWLRPANDTQPRRAGHIVQLDGWPSDGASATVWLEDGQQVRVALGVPTQLDVPVQAAVLTHAADADGSWASCTIRVDGAVVSSDRIDLPGAPASCSWPL